MLLKMVNKWLTALQHLVYPPTCILCLDAVDPRGKRRDLCSPCFADLPRNDPACPICAETMPMAGTLCGRCQKKRPPFDKVYAPFVYDFPIQQLVGALKFQGRLSLTPLLAELLGDELEKVGAIMPDVLMPVPLHSSRLRGRGYNQVLELARPLARRFDLPLELKACKRIKSTGSLANLARKQRQKSIRGVFALDPEFHARHVVILDDVVTTGSTVAEMAKLLRKVGVEQIDVWAVARTAEHGVRSTDQIVRVEFDIS